MIRPVSVMLITLAGLACAVPARAQCLKTFANNVIRDFRRNNCWPEPFIRADRHAVRAPFALMVHNGWRRQNMLADHHFEEGGDALNEAGRLKVRWIMTQAPRHHRTIFVHRADTPEETATRMNLVQQVAVQFVDEGQLPQVLETNIDALGWPAERIDSISRKWLDSTPDPRLPAAQADSGSTN